MERLFRLKYTCLVSVLCPSLVTCLLLKSWKRKVVKTNMSSNGQSRSRSQFRLEKTKLPLRNSRGMRGNVHETKFRANFANDVTFANTFCWYLPDDVTDTFKMAVEL